MSPARLHQLLRSHAGFFRRRGVEVPSAEAPVAGWQAVARCILEASPAELPPSLHSVSTALEGLATWEARRALLEDAASLGVAIHQDEDPVPPAELAVEVWRRNPLLIARRHVELARDDPRPFKWYWTREPVEVDPALDRDHSCQIGRAMSEELRAANELPDVNVSCHPQDDGALCFVHRPATAGARGDSSSSIFYRPSPTPPGAELQVSAPDDLERDVYVRVFSRHLAGRDDAFTAAPKFTLDPLRPDGGAAAGPGADGLVETARLQELKLFRPGGCGEIETRQATDLSDALKRPGRGIPARATLLRAGFEIRFRDVPTPRMVFLQPPSVIECARHGDSLRVEGWLEERGFLLPTGADADAETDTVLDRA